MSAFFMFAIAAMYAGAAVAFGYEGKWSWCVIACCWGTGNAILGAISR